MGEVRSLQSATGTGSDCCVRVTDRNHKGFIEFQFSMGDPTIFLEMTLPPAAFVEFCARHRARHLSALEATVVDRRARRWHCGDEDED